MSDQINKTILQPAIVNKTTVTQQQGPAGPPGDLTPGSGDLNYDHDQMSASAFWTVTHNLGKYPSVTVVDSSGAEIEGDVRHLSMSQLTIEFSAGFAGHAFCN